MVTCPRAFLGRGDARGGDRRQHEGGYVTGRGNCPACAACL